MARRVVIPLGRTLLGSSATGALVGYVGSAVLLFDVSIRQSNFVPGTVLFALTVMGPWLIGPLTLGLAVVGFLAGLITRWFDYGRSRLMFVTTLVLTLSLGTLATACALPWTLWPSGVILLALIGTATVCAAEVTIPRQQLADGN